LTLRPFTDTLDINSEHLGPCVAGQCNGAGLQDSPDPEVQSLLAHGEHDAVITPKAPLVVVMDQEP
jgi:hypothetical protein